MEFLLGAQPPHDLTYSDVFLVPTFADVGSRSDVDLTTPDDIGTTIPIVVANMTAVAGRRMAETIARRGGVAILPQDIPASAVADMTAAVKRSDLVLETPITLRGSDTVTDAMNLIYKRSHGAVIIVDDETRPIGIFTATDGEGWDRFTPLSSVMTPDPIVLGADRSTRELFDELAARRLHLAPVIDGTGRLAGVITEKGALRASVYRPAVDAAGRLMVGAALGVNGDVAARARDLLDVGIDILVLDTAHGHQQKMLEALAAVRSLGPTVPVVAGNVVTAAGTEALIEAGADIVKVGVGPGAMCTTRMMTGVGRPQFSSIRDCAAAARSAGRQIWADGGVRFPRDVALALAAGAGNVMIDSWFAGTFESAADTMRDPDGRLYKENYGMASARAVSNRARRDTPFDRAHKEMFEEGISHSRMYLLDDTPSVEDIVDRIVTGVRSACTYAGARTIDELHANAVIGVQSMTGYAEGLPQGTSW